MRKALFIICALAGVHAANAQLSLSGSDYTQNFNSLSATSPVLPAGWQLSVNSTATILGTDVTSTKYDASGKTWKNVSNGFRNVASANGYTYFATIGNDSAAQAQHSDRALAIRQTSAVGDSSTAFLLQIANTQNLSNFKIDFKLQSLDSTSPRVTTWLVDYGVGANPTSFTPATITSTTPLTTGGNTFSNNTIAASFGTGLDNKAGNVWIRIVTLTKTTGSQNRATSAIDDVHITWSGNAVPNAINNTARQELPLTVIGNPSASGFDVQWNASTTGNYQLAVYDIAGRKVYSRKVAVNGGLQQFTVNGLNLNSGMYVVKMNNETYSGTAKAIIK
jgi:hypothetical protein